MINSRMPLYAIVCTGVVTIVETYCRTKKLLDRRVLVVVV